MSAASAASKPTGTVLDRILETKRAEIAALLGGTTRRELAARCTDLPPTRGFAANLTAHPNLTPRPPLPRGEGGKEEGEPEGSGFAARSELPLSQRGTSDGERGLEGKVRTGVVRLIAEVKKASPSKGVIRPDFDPVAIARAYEKGGASCLSVLTDVAYFQGSLDYLGAVREAVSLPLLRKDFLIDPAQIYEARLAGADAVLLIVAAVPSAARLAELRHVAESVGLDALVEVHDADELEIARESGATLIGVNNRDLRDFTVRLELAEALLPAFPKGAVCVAESGIFTAEDAQRMGRAGAQAVLVGEALMRASDIAAATAALLAPATV